MGLWARQHFSFKMSTENQRWFVIRCDSDDSFVLLPDDKVIYDETVEVGDTVNFTYPGVKELLVGTVKGVSGKSLSLLLILFRII